MMPTAAFDYLKQGFSIIPCSQDKRPLIPWAEFQMRRPTAEEVTEWWNERTDANIAIVCGKLSNLTVIDCDTAAAIEKIESLLPDGLEVSRCLNQKCY
jgi:hypothetical protein